MLQLARPRPSALNISCQAPRATTSFATPSKSPSPASSVYPASPAIILPQSIWSPNIPSPLSLHAIHSPGPPRTPLSPINPFLVAPRRSTALDSHALFPMAAPLLPASPLSLFDGVVSPTSAGVIARTPTSKPLTTQDMRLSPISPLSPRFLFPRTPPCVPCFKAQRRASAWDAIERKMSVASVLSMAPENMRVGMGIYHWLALRRWEMATRNENKEKGWLNVEWRKLLRRVDAANEPPERTRAGPRLML